MVTSCVCCLLPLMLPCSTQNQTRNNTQRGSINLATAQTIVKQTAHRERNKWKITAALTLKEDGCESEETTCCCASIPSRACTPVAVVLHVSRALHAVQFIRFRAKSPGAAPLQRGRRRRRGRASGMPVRVHDRPSVGGRKKVGAQATQNATEFQCSATESKHERLQRKGGSSVSIQDFRARVRDDWAAVVSL
eukprot:1650334-Pleurochrysis_carterae.AAC.2